jgi:DNA-binding NtrC family response regulator
MGFIRAAVKPSIIYQDGHRPSDDASVSKIDSIETLVLPSPNFSYPSATRAAAVYRGRPRRRVISRVNTRNWRFRIIAATNRRLDQEAAAGRFRADLRFRLDVVRIEVPPLRDRASDVPMLASRFWDEAAGRVGTRATLGPDAVAALSRYEWPGNVRELQNVIAWMAVQSPRRGRIGSAALPAHVAHAGTPTGTTFEEARQEFERRFVKAALASADGQRARAAEALGITRQGLAKMMRRLGLDGER